MVSSDSLLFVIDPQPYQLALDNAQAAVVRTQSELAKANHEAECRRHLPKNIISGADLEIANLTADSMKAAYQGAVANLEQAKWNLSKTRIYAPANGYITNLQTRVGNYATTGTPLVALIDTDSFYVMGYFEETKLRHIREGNEAKIVLYNGNIPLRGVVESIGRARSSKCASLKLTGA